MTIIGIERAGVLHPGCGGELCYLVEDQGHKGGPKEGGTAATLSDTLICIDSAGVTFVCQDVFCVNMPL